jgi:hypothetical protein
MFVMNSTSHPVIHLQTRVDTILNYAASDPGALEDVPGIGTKGAKELRKNGIPNAHYLDSQLSLLLTAEGGDLRTSLERFREWLRDNGAQPGGGGLNSIPLAIALRVQQRYPRLVSEE